VIPLFLLATVNAAPTPSPPAETAPRPLRAALTSSSAFGLTHARFFNQLLGARLDYRFTPQLAFGGSVSYANLEGKARRAHNVLPEVSTEYRVTFEGNRVALPLRLSLGYLPKNGPTLRVAAGFDIALSRAVSLELIALEPMIWVTRDRPEISLNGSLALGVTL
jgi:hypothetical protein